VSAFLQTTPGPQGGMRSGTEGDADDVLWRRKYTDDGEIKTKFFASLCQLPAELPRAGRSHIEAN
jgi:hypothetical protein